jgi:hypothetical protein
MLIEKADHKDFFKASFMSGKATTKRCRKQRRANQALHLTAIPLRSKAAGELGR